MHRSGTQLSTVWWCCIKWCCVCVCVSVQTTLELLDYHYSDEKVRSMAVKRLEALEDDELVEILLQLVQVRGARMWREGDGGVREGGVRLG